MSVQTDETEEIEGVGNEEEDSSWKDYPIDTLLIRNETRTVHDVLRRIDKGSFIMNPDFQREFLWDDEKQSKLIESVLLRIPLPVFYLAEDEEGHLIVVDGLQRLSTFKRYVDNTLPLKLPHNEDLNKKRFKDLSPKLQNRIEDCNLILYVIDAKVPERAKLDIFERVNGGVPLTRQQMRNCLYMGPATRFLKDEAATPEFLEATGKSLSQKMMRDREFVNRFCAFQLLPLREYKGDMDDFLAQVLKLMNNQDEEDLQTLSAQFRISMRNNYSVFGRHSFRKSILNPNGKREVINASIWDVMSTGLSQYPIDLVDTYSGELKQSFSNLMMEEDFSKSITTGTNEVKKVRYRFSEVREMLKEVLGDRAS
jgi:hypothetical protein